MLRALDIRDILIIDHLELNFQPGLNVLTGETGAGKSILLDSLGFVLGWRGRAELVRQGAKQGEVLAEFDLPPDHPAHAVLAEAGLPGGDTLLLRRVNTAEGRKTAWVNDRRCSGEVLRALSETLLELHGQHDDRGLLNPRGHRAMLDEFAGLGDMLATVRDRWATASRARKAVEETRVALEAIRAEEDFLRHAVAELDALDPQPGEDAALDQRRREMQSAERIRGDIQRAQGILSEGAEAALGDAQRWLEGVSDQAENALDAPIAALLRAMIELGEAQDGVARVLEGLDFNPGELEESEERLFAIRALARKHDVLPDDLGGYAETLRQKLAAVDAGDQDMANQEAALAEAEAVYAGAAAQLSAARRETAAALDTAVMAELAPLKMERAVFETRLTDTEPGPEGKDAVAFTVATNPGAPAGPLNKIASGGELSRFLLALKVCLRGETGNQTMIFDEIDRGVGGATADAVGRRLKSLAEGSQVLVVTHSPQVAAQGAHHWRVQKQVIDGQTLSQVVPLDEGERVDELARMVSGDTITPEARAAAKALLAG
ncbi:DNA repair protein RecN [Phaeobacter gallaeciensis]|uniref:DNA repair protein RecN n=1 Tax=Phaeobacter gallaeciensis TaxID=60890 RepID=A0AAD0EC03_9RHOB|nr:DNA repair protein RecN [Phaeobacter gallaeciensis]AHD10264.1 DNA replication and repair protein RecN [Phaeobacter gallaeciensis DSM 26640]ATE93528.1 DNA repair protein RecN [Phaeobacter gallaeciensis]ATE96651.1 DNA repair protein RecN [Phaeobacter gallaeciensis]ATF02192.1 DNA repair protein RecN [Phaeobacter gallaeciensis]ATF06572.1 DNA repair protein RecN [Phaeobacter gallaeciensis]